MTDYELAVKIAEKAAAAGGRVYFVGGFVRNKMAGLGGDSPTDIDIEVHGLEAEKLREILGGFGTLLEYGSSFGIFGLSGSGLDIAMPRKEHATGRGHRDFEIDVDPFIGTKAAAGRRDFTVNSMMEDILTGEIIDHFGGRSDLEKGIL